MPIPDACMERAKKRAVSALGMFLLRVSSSLVGLCLLLLANPAGKAAESSAMERRIMQEEQHLQRLAGASKPGPILFEIPSQAIAPALIQFGEQAGTSVLIQHEAGEVQSAGLMGAYPPLVGLERLLAGTGLGFRVTDAGIVVFRPAAHGGAEKVDAALAKRQTSVWGRIGALFAGVALGGGGGLAAAEAGQTDGGNAFIEEIVVTAQKREQAITDVGLTINAFSGEDVRDFRLDDVTNLDSYNANINIKTTLAGSNPVVTVRGVGQNDFNANTNSSVGIYVDGVFQPSSASFAAVLFDVERIEVLKGPQGTLYGRNSTGGAINVISRYPTQEFDGYVNVGVGDYDLLEVETAVGGGLGENTAGRLSLKYSRQGESFHSDLLSGDDFGDADDISVRGQLLFAPSDNLDIRLIARHSAYEGPPSPRTFFGTQDPVTGETCAAVLANDSSFRNCVGPAGFPDPTRFPVAGPLQASDDDPFTHVHDADDLALLTFDSDISAMVVDVNWRLSDTLSLTSISGYDFLDRVFVENVGSHVLQFGILTHDEEISQFSQEVRLTNEAASVSWILGAYYAKFDFESENIFRTRDLLVPFLGGNMFWDNDQSTTSWALFGNADWRFSDSLTLVLGLRYSSDDVDFTGGTDIVNTDDLSNIDAGTILAGLTDADNNFDDENVSTRVALEYRPTDDWLVYGAVATGFKTGGFFGDFTFEEDELLPADSESLVAYEGGFKATLAGGRMQLNGSIFFNDYQDIQTIVAGPIFPILGNVDEAEIFGVDLDLTAVPLQGLTTKLSVSFLDSELSAYGTLADGSAAVPAGNSLPNAPEMQVVALARYEFPLSDALSASIQVDFKYTDDMFRDAENTVIVATDSYTLVNARATVFESTGEQWEVAVWGKNLGDEVYRTGGILVPFGFANGEFGDPRTFGLSVSYYFQ